MSPIVLFYHQVLRAPRPDHSILSQCLTVDQFRAAILQVREARQIIGMRQLCDSLEGKTKLPERAAVITFDDGFRNNLFAAQVLHELGLTATFFVLTEPIGSTFKPWYIHFAHIVSTRSIEVASTPWGDVDFRNRLSRRRWQFRAKESLLSVEAARRDDQLAELSSALQSPPMPQNEPDLEFLSPDDLRQLVELGMTIGGHSASHDNMTRLSATDLRRELVESADQLAAITGEPIETMSYPDGRFNGDVVAVAKTRYRMAFGASPMLSTGDRYRYPRRPADNVQDVRPLLSAWYPWKRTAIDFVKKLIVQ